MPTADRQEQFSILTLTPNSWSVSETEEFFGVSKYAVMKAMAIKQEKGILGKADPIGRKYKFKKSN